jgi:hypothetical protein
MRYALHVESGCLRAELFDRRTVEETREFLRASIAEGIKHGCTAALILVRSSRPIFQVEQYHLSEYIKELAARPDVHVALVAADGETHATHQYIELLAKQQGAHVRAFRLESEAAEWLRSPSEFRQSDSHSRNLTRFDPA